ncbi:MAG: TRAP transporter small permease [Deltaproteobacteria bacterium]|nr:TRAP transporter small permease [Deltaproteobacteria bacterium]
MHRTVQYAEKGIKAISKVLSKISGTILALMMFLTVADVILRYFFNSPILGAFEVTEYMMVIFVFLGLAHNQEQKDNISIDVVVDRLGGVHKNILRAITNMMGLGFFALMSWRLAVYGLKILNDHQISRELHIPVFPFIFVTSFGAIVLCMVLLADVVRSICKGFKE